MNTTAKYFVKKIGTELIVSGVLFGITSGVKYASKKFFDRKTDRELKQLLKDA